MCCETSQTAITGTGRLKLKEHHLQQKIKENCGKITYFIQDIRKLRKEKINYRNFTSLFAMHIALL